MATFNGIIAVSPTGAKSVLYLTRSDNNSVVSLNGNDGTALLQNGVYAPRSFDGGQGQEENRKRAKRLVVYGEGESVSGTLTITLDGDRSVSYPVRGPYSTNDGILFFQEVDPAVVTARQFDVSFEEIAGIGVSITDVRFEFIEIG